MTNIRDAARLVATLHGLADELLARGLVTLAYAAALGQPHPTMISAGEVASRHDFRLRRQTAGAGAWRLPIETAGGVNAWHVTGSVLGLDVQLAGFSLVRLSTRPLLRKPTLNDEDRRAFIEAVAIVEPSSLSDEDRDLIVAAMKQGRARVAGVQRRARRPFWPRRFALLRPGAAFWPGLSTMSRARPVVPVAERVAVAGARERPVRPAFTPGARRGDRAWMPVSAPG